jgi:hypothetical protein
MKLSANEGEIVVCGYDTFAVALDHSPLPHIEIYDDYRE